MKTKIVLFLFSMLCLIFFLNSGYALGIAADEFNSSPGIILGGEWVNILHWLLLGTSFTLMMISGFSILSQKISESNKK